MKVFFHDLHLILSNYFAAFIKLFTLLYYMIIHNCTIIMIFLDNNFLKIYAAKICYTLLLEFYILNIVLLVIVVVCLT